MKYIIRMIINLLGFISAPIVFPIAYGLRKVKIVRNKLLWYYYDDEDEFGYEVEWWMMDRKRNFATAYKWCAIRNPAWNLHASSKLPNVTKEYVFKSPKGSLRKNHKVVYPSLNVSAVLKYVDKDGKYMDNKGEYLSLTHSILGSQFVRFYNQVDARRYWRYTFADRVVGSIWIELQIGYTTRPTFRLKIKNIKKNEVKE